jgi:putative membrane protein
MTGVRRVSAMMHWSNWSGGWSDGYFGAPLAMHILWYGALLGLVAVVVIYLMKRSERTSGANRALDVLKERYARGDLTKDDFDRMRKDILV